MSRQTMMETLKGGILLMILLMLALMIIGGFISWRMSKRPGGRELQVQVKLQEPLKKIDRTAEPGQELRPGSDGIFIPEHAVDVTPPGMMTPLGPTDVSAERMEILKKTGLEKVVCRSFAMQGAENDSVRVCSFDMGSLEKAVKAFTMIGPGPANSDRPGFDRVRVDHNGFFLVQGRRYYEITRSSNNDSTRRLAMAFVTKIGAHSPERPSITIRLPDRNLDAGSIRDVAGTTVGCPAIELATAARYRIGNEIMTLAVSVSESATRAGELAGLCAASIRSDGGIEQQGRGIPADIKVFKTGNSLKIAGSRDRMTFLVLDVTDIGAAIKLIRELEKSKPEIPVKS